MSEMVERVATRLAEDAKRIRAELREIQGMSHLPLPALHWTLFEREARVAIEAMREPTEAMLDAGDIADGYDVYVGVWGAMIDAALK